MGYILMNVNLQNCLDDELVEYFKQGNKDAFDELVYRYKNSLYQYILSLVKDEGAAGDLFQEVFLAFFKHIDTYKAQGKFKSWLFLTARNKTLNYFRDNSPTDSLDQTDDDGNTFMYETVASDEPNPLEALSDKEAESTLHKLMASLPEKQKEILLLRQYLSFKEIAELVNRPLGTVLADAHRAIKKMQNLLLRQQQLEEIL